jgi:hypothetical protein
MVTSYLILIISAALFCFYLQASCQRILRREFEQEYFKFIVKANQLGFPQIAEALEQFGLPVEYSRLRTVLLCDFLTLTYMLKHAANLKQRYSAEERLLVLYFRLMLFSLRLRHLLRLQEKSTVLKLAVILKYFANVVGQRVSLVRFGNLSAADYLQSL